MKIPNYIINNEEIGGRAGKTIKEFWGISICKPQYVYFGSGMKGIKNFNPYRDLQFNHLVIGWGENNLVISKNSLLGRILSIFIL